MSERARSVKPPVNPAVRQVAEGFAQIAAVLREDATRSGGRAGVSAAQARTLALLEQVPSGMRLSEIAARLGVTPASASETVAGLVRRRLARREKDSRDGRAARFKAEPGASMEGGVATRESGLDQALSSLARRDLIGLERLLVQLILFLQESGRVEVARACVNCRFFRPMAHRGKALPHHCDFVDKPFSDGALRISCADFEVTGREHAQANQTRWLRGFRRSKSGTRSRERAGSSF